ncbi:MAG: C25 family cysteine peptidase [Acidobacteriota bacterium]
MLRTNRPLRPVLLALLIACLAPAALLARPSVDATADAFPPAAIDPDGLKLYVADDGVYRVTFDDCVAAGLDPAAARASDAIVLRQASAVVPLHVDDGGDGTFDAGDALVFIGTRPRGASTDRHPTAEQAMLTLRFDDDARAAPGARMIDVPPPSADLAPADDQKDALDVAAHIEENRLRVRFAAKRDRPAPAEVWYGAKITHLDRAHRQVLHLEDLDRRAEQPVALSVHLRGYSEPRAKANPDDPDHQVEVLFNFQPVATASWDGQAAETIHIDALPAGLVRAGDNVLQIKVPARPGARPDTPLIDVVLLDWVRIVYPRTGAVGEDQRRVRLDRADPARPLALQGTSGRPPVLYSVDGRRAEAVTRGGNSGTSMWGQRYRVMPPCAAPNAGAADRCGGDGGSSKPAIAYVVPDPSAMLTPVAIRPARVDRLRRADAAPFDYAMIAHPHLRDAVAPLADFHRERGLRVQLVDVEEIYDAYSDGLVDPGAIRQYLHEATARHPDDPPRFALLVGDASWNRDATTTHDDDTNYADWTYRPGEIRKFSKNESTAYADPGPDGLSHRDLVPAAQIPTYQGNAASDNWFVAFDPSTPPPAQLPQAHLDPRDAPFKPAMAIGRFPVVSADDVTTIVDKTLAYAQADAVGPWRRRVLWITNEQKNFQVRSARLDDLLRQRGFSGQRVFPTRDDADPSQHQRALRAAFDDGQLLVQFLGHGGRYIWRTGAPDLRKNQDLFTLDHLDELAPNDRLPVVLSLTCYSAPFDHPTADSIGEKFLRLDGRGAVAVFAASWRNNPSPSFNRALIDALIEPGTPLGEAIRLAKQSSNNRLLVQTYNLLGDPALALALPRVPVTLDVPASAHPKVAAALPPWRADDYAVRATLGAPVGDLSPMNDGRALVEWVDDDGVVLHTAEVAVVDGAITASWPGGDAPAATPVRDVRVYTWNADRGLDGIGAVRLPKTRVLPALQRAADGAEAEATGERR